MELLTYSCTTFQPRTDESASFITFCLLCTSLVPSLIFFFGCIDGGHAHIRTWRCVFASFSFAKTLASCLYWFSFPFRRNVKLSHKFSSIFAICEFEMSICDFCRPCWESSYLLDNIDCKLSRSSPCDSATAALTSVATAFRTSSAPMIKLWYVLGDG